MDKKLFSIESVSSKDRIKDWFEVVINPQTNMVEEINEVCYPGEENIETHIFQPFAEWLMEVDPSAKANQSAYFSRFLHFAGPSESIEMNYKSDSKVLITCEQVIPTWVM